MNAKPQNVSATIRRYAVVMLMTVMIIPAAALSGDDDGDKKERRMRQIFAELGITPEQQTKLRDIHAKAVPGRRVSKKQLEVIREKIKQEMQKDRPSRSTLNRYAADMGNLHRQMNLAAIDNLLQIKAVLTPAQFSALSARGFIGGPDGLKRMHIDKKDRASGRGSVSPGGDNRHPKRKYQSGGDSGKRRLPPRMCCDHDCKFKRDSEGGFIETPITPVPLPERIAPLPDNIDTGE